MKFINLVGQKFGRLKVKKYFGNSKWECLCKCGNRVFPRGADLKNGKTGSCGCLQKEITIKRSLKHGFKTRKNGHRFYNIWSNLKSRCKYQSVKCYKNYGGRGIKNLWESFEEFKKDMYRSYKKHVKEFGEKDTQIERINVNGHYCKENCKWVTILEQARNKRYNLPLIKRNVIVE